MIILFLSHISKRFFRSASAGKGIAIQIILGFIALAVVANLLAVGWVLEWLIFEKLKQSNPIVFLNGLLIYYFIGDFVIRYFMQSLPSWDVLAYLHLPISRSKIVNFFLGRSMLNIINTFVFLLFAPFAFSAVTSVYGISQAWVWIVSLWFISLINHFVVVLLKKNLADSVWGLLTFIILCVILASSDYFGWYKLSIVSEKLFGSLFQGYTSLCLLFLLLVLLYVSAYRLFINRLYPEELNVQENQTFLSTEWTFLQNFGLMGTWIKTEFKLIVRNKRSREIFLLNIAVYFQTLILYHITHHTAYGSLLFFGIIGSGFFAIMYGQFLFSWQGQHFDFILTQPTSIRLFMESKYWLLASITTLWFLFSIPFVYLGWHILLINLVVTFYNVGINIFVVMNIAMWGVRRIDLKHSGSLNYEGMGAAQWILAIPFFASPYLFYLPFSLMGYPILGLVSIGMAGLIGIIFHGKLIDFTIRRFSTMRYIMAFNFRKD